MKRCAQCDGRGRELYFHDTITEPCSACAGTGMLAADTIPAPPPEDEPSTLPTGGCIECRQAPCACQFEVRTYPLGELDDQDSPSAGAHIEAYDRLGEGR